MNTKTPRHRFRSAACLLLAGLVALSTPLAALAEGRSAPSGVGMSGNIGGKEEVVYATLDTDGSVESAYVVNILQVTEAGTITDRGSYDSVRNLTDTGELDYSGGTVTAQAERGLFYYQGNMAGAELPWAIDIRYALDGRETAPEELAGADGALEIGIQTTWNGNTDPVFYENYMLQVSVTLDAGRCTDIEAEGATLVNSGGDKLITFTVMPSADGDMAVSANVTDFAMPTGISISAVPFSMDIDLGDMTEMTDGLIELSDAIVDLNEGVGELAQGSGELASGVGEIKTAIDSLYSGLGSMSTGAGQLYSGARELSTGTAALSGGLGELAEGSGELKAGIDALSGGAEELITGSAAIYSGLQALGSSLDGEGGEPDLSELAGLPAGLTTVADGLDELAESLGTMAEGLGQGITALEGAVGAIPDGGVSGDSIAALYALAAEDPALQGTIAALVGGYEAAQTVKGVWANVSGAFSGVSAGLPTVQSSLATMAGTLRTTAAGVQTAISGLGSDDALSELTGAIGALTTSYGTFHQGLSEYLEGVGAVAEGYGELHTGISRSASGAREVASGTSTYASGVGEYATGVGEAAGGTGQLASGAGELASGTNALADGIAELYDGTQEMEEETRDLPDEIDEAIDELTGEYDTSDFRPVSFVTGEAEGIEAVQFVLQTGPISAPDTGEPVDEMEEDEGFFSRLLALFGF